MCRLLPGPAGCLAWGHGEPGSAAAGVLRAAPLCRREGAEQGLRGACPRQGRQARDMRLVAESAPARQTAKTVAAAAGGLQSLARGRPVTCGGFSAVPSEQAAACGGPSGGAETVRSRRFALETSPPSFKAFLRRPCAVGRRQPGSPCAAKGVPAFPGAGGGRLPGHRRPGCPARRRAGACAARAPDRPGGWAPGALRFQGTGVRLSSSETFQCGSGCIYSKSNSYNIRNITL